MGSVLLKMAPIPGLSHSLSKLHRACSTKVINARHVSSVNLTGIFPPIVTPFNEDESIAWDKLRGNLARWRKEPLAGFLVHGSNGEFAYLTAKERVEVIRVVKEEVGEGQLVLAGSGCESTCETIEMTSAMADAGADAAVVYTPCYYKAKMTSPALEKHFIEVADASPIPIVLYSVPANTTIDLPVASVARLSSHPNIIGMKDSSLLRALPPSYCLHSLWVQLEASVLLPTPCQARFALSNSCSVKENGTRQDSCSTG